MKQNMNFTPGPWHCSSTMLGKAYGVGAENNDNICHVIGPHENGADEFKANARLIAAAPDLFEALADILEWWEVTPCRPAGEEPCGFKEGRDAIAKARGRS